MKRGWFFLIVACACLWPAGDSFCAQAAALFPAQAVEVSSTAEVVLAWPEEGERRKWFPEQPKDFILMEVISAGGRHFHFVERQPARQPRGRGKAFYRFKLAGTAVPWTLKMDLGRKIPLRWLQKPKGLKVRRSQWIESGRVDRDLEFSISDAVLKHYPPMTLKQKKASLNLVEAAAAELGRK